MLCCAKFQNTSAILHQVEETCPNVIVRNSGVVGRIQNTGLSTTVSMFYSFIVDILLCTSGGTSHATLGWMPLLCMSSGCAGTPLTFDVMHVLHF